MKTALADAQTNLQKAQERMKRAVDKRRRSEAYKVGDEVVLTTANLRSYCPHLPPKIKARWVGPLSHHPRDLASCIWIGFATRLANSSRLPCEQAQTLYPLGGVLTGG